MPALPARIAAAQAARKAGSGRDAAFPPEAAPLREWLLERYVARGQQFFGSLVAVDAEGHVLGRAGRDDAGGPPRLAPETPEERKQFFDRPFTWRNWFNGERDYPDDQATLRKPVDRPYIAQPYIGKFFNRDRTR